MPGAAEAPYPDGWVNHEKLNRVLRHRLRNLSAGVLMTLDAIEDSDEPAPELLREKFCAIRAEIGELLGFSERLDLLFHCPPAAVPMYLHEVLAELVTEFGRDFPFCTLELDGDEAQVVLACGNWYLAALRELLANAGSAAGRDGTVQIRWQSAPVLRLIVLNAGEAWPSELRQLPPQPFCSDRPRHDGLGLAIAFRLCRLMNVRMDIRCDRPGLSAVVLAGLPEEPTV